MVAPDVQLAKHADIVIAYNTTSEELIERADIVLPKDGLINARDVIVFTKQKLNANKFKYC